MRYYCIVLVIIILYVCNTTFNMYMNVVHAYTYVYYIGRYHSTALFVAYHQQDCNKECDGWISD